MKVLKNGKIIKEDGIIEGYALVVEGEKISNIIENDKVVDGDYEEVLDCQGKYISPGFIDIHSDFIEQIVSPRPIVVVDFGFALRETERLLVTSGITTMYHSLALMPYNLMEKEIRKRENVVKLVDAINKLDEEPHIIHNRVHLRLEISNFDFKDRVKELIKENKVHLLSFMDHTPGQGQYRDFEMYKKTMRSYDAKLTDEELDNKIQEEINNPKLKIEDLKELADFAKSHGVALASHDDDSIEKLKLVKEMGASISEFPIYLEVAQAARDMGLHTVVGAPNILIGKSHAGNLSAREAIVKGVATVISSDYYPSSMLTNLFKMEEEYGIDLHEMFNMVTINPARAVGIDDKTGSIEIGKNADLLVIEKRGTYPIISSVLVDGHPVFKTSYRYDQ